MPRVSYEDVPTEEVEDWVRAIVREELELILNNLFIDLSKLALSAPLTNGTMMALTKHLRDTLPQ